jgi:hypothetical protein
MKHSNQSRTSGDIRLESYWNSPVKTTTFDKLPEPIYNFVNSVTNLNQYKKSVNDYLMQKSTNTQEIYHSSEALFKAIIFSKFDLAYQVENQYALYEAILELAKKKIG